jgi:hypothetical protein
LLLIEAETGQGSESEARIDAVGRPVAHGSGPGSQACACRDGSR